MALTFKLFGICVLFSHLCGIFGNEGKNEVLEIGGLDVKDTIEKFLKELRLKIPKKFEFSDYSLTIPANEYIQGNINFSNITFTGLKEFNATVIYGRFLTLPKAYIFLLENLVLNLHYKSDVVIYNSTYLSLFGDGIISLTLKNLIFDGNISVSVLPINASVTADVDLDDTVVNMTGLLDDQDFSNKIGGLLGEGIKNIFDRNKRPLSKFLTDTLNFLIQIVLHHRSYIIGSESQNSELDD